MFNPIVINSKAAQKHLNEIKFQYADILQGLQDHNLRLTALKNENQMKDKENKASEMETNKMNMEMETKKLAEENKRKELEIKAMALSL